jgi:uncharacterized protein YbbK (DUF523 family)
VIRVSVEVSRGAARYRVAVQAESIKRALEIVKSQSPSCAAKVVFPIEPEEFYVEDATVTAESLDREVA